MAWTQPEQVMHYDFLNYEARYGYYKDKIYRLPSCHLFESVKKMKLLDVLYVSIFQ